MMKKILIIATSSDSLMIFRKALIVDFQKKYFDVHVAAPNINSNTVIREQLDNLGVAYHQIKLDRTGLNIYSDFLSIISLTKLIFQIKPDYVLSYTIKPVIYGAIVSKFLGVKNIYSLITGLGYIFISLDDSKYKTTKLQKIVFVLYKISLFFSKKVIFQNPDDANLFEDMKLVNPEKINIVNGSGVDLSFYDYDISILEDYTSEQSLKFLMLGRIIGDKGIREYIGAARELKKKYGKKVVFQLGGGLDTNPTAILKEELDEWINTGIIEYLGELKDVRPAITNSHVFILPSYREGTSRSILEAMSVGRPIITTNVAGCRQLVEVGKNGYLAEPKSVQSLIKEIDKIIQLSSSEIVKMGSYSRKIVEEKYDVRKVNKDMLSIMGVV
ncbi:glycosyltransferase family 4 protein [Acinetobacter lwoffii]|uniref:glycosyltransferase family 4 protein n=1 Tax=Acinetobacter lwoffii TaxID=28090 RepID=UPI001C5B2058|nr:glycosyltransferase family 4 protein [Acinetobacter lwoffii]QXX85727.1 glycosyltransferase family 4 protein [Acinetobacter lwoffii]